MPRPRDNPNNPSKDILIANGQRLKKLRTKAGLTQQELADRLGVSRTSVGSYEAGRIHMLETTLVEIAKVLKVSTDELMGLSVSKKDTPVISRRLMKRFALIDTLSEPKKKHIIKVIDDFLTANK